MINVGPECYTYATAINEQGDVVGWYKCGALGDPQIFFWSEQRGIVRIPPPPGAASARASDINDLGQIVGSAGPVLIPCRGFIYEDGEFTILPPVPGGAFSWANGINNHGEVVGTRSIGQRAENAYLWSRSTGFVDLGLMGTANTEGFGINDRGQATGIRGSFFSSDEAFIRQDGRVEFRRTDSGRRYEYAA